MHDTVMAKQRVVRRENHRLSMPSMQQTMKLVEILSDGNIQHLCPLHEDSHFKICGFTLSLHSYVLFVGSCRQQIRGQLAASS